MKSLGADRDNGIGVIGALGIGNMNEEVAEAEYLPGLNKLKTVRQTVS